MPRKSFYIQSDNLYIVPVCHYRFEFAWYVNRAICEISPDDIAVELPGTLEEPITTAIKRFPYLSVVFYQNGNGEYIYFPVEPSDPLCEAVRCGLDMNIPLHFADLDVDDYPLLFDPVPDSYSIYIIGLESYWNAYDKIVNSGEREVLCQADEMREIQMAYSLQKLLQKGRKVLLVCGMAHVRSILEKLKTPQVQAIGRVVRKDLRIFNLSLSSIREVTGETPFFISLYEMLRGNPAKKSEEKEKKEEAMVISLEERRKKKEALSGEEGKEKTVVPLYKDGKKSPLFTIKEEDIAEKEEEELLTPKPPPSTVFLNVASQKYSDFISKLMKFITPKLSKLNEIDEGKALMDFASLEFNPVSSPYKKKEVEIHKFKTCEDRRDELFEFYRSLVSSNSSEELKDNIPRSRYSLDYDLFDRQKLILELIKKSSLFYQENTGDEIKTWQTRVLMKFSRNYAMVTGRLLPDFFQLITCARSVSDDNLGYEVWDLGSFYPWIDESGEFQTVDIHAEEVWLYGKKITLRRKKPRLRNILRPLFLKDRKNEKDPGEWEKSFDRYCICSYPPEDIIIEDYGIYLRKKGKKMLSEEQARTVPFTSSLLDGIDVKETIRNWHEKKLYVKKAQQIQGGVGSVVVIFDEDHGDVKYPWKMTWQGEHGQESDMALYATSPTDKIVGPGIARCEYGGFMMSYPPMRIWDVWGDPFYSYARSKAEILLLSAVEYSLERYVAYIAAKPPRSWFRSFAGRLNKKIIYIPIGTLSPVTLKKIRVFHVLSGHQVREFAKDYVW